MGLLDKARETNERRAGQRERDEAWAGRRFEFKALNLKKVPGMALENELNEWGARGYEVRCTTHDHYVVLQREVA
jgi:hypothetical protein